MPVWRDDKILELANQLTYSPADKRREQMNSAIALLPGIEAQKVYPWDFVHFRITGFQSRSHSDYLIGGKVLRADLSTLIEFLSDTLALSLSDVPAGDAVMEMEAVSRKFNVSSKTIQRWRKQGLIGLRYVHPDGRRRLGFLESAIQQFAAANQEKIDKSAAFKQLSDEERRQIIEMAELSLAEKASIKELSHRIARALGRAPETIRYTIRNYDREHPEAAIFVESEESGESRRESRSDMQAAGGAGGTAGGGGQGVLFEDNPSEQAAAGAPLVDDRAGRLLHFNIEFVSNPLFDHPDAGNIILNVLPGEALVKAQATVGAGTNAKADDVFMARVPGGLPAYLATIFMQPVMPQELEVDAFRRMNYLKYRAARLQAEAGGAGGDGDEAARLDRIENYLKRSADLKNQILQNNLRVAVHVARKHQRPDRQLMELVSDATIWLMRTIETFDFARNTRFSTYAGYAIMKNFARDRSEHIARRDPRLVTGQEEAINSLGSRQEEHVAEQVDAASLAGDLRSVIEELPERERKLVSSHFGLDADGAQSLAEIGDAMGITKARVQQLEARALRRLRHLMEKRREKIQNAAQKK